METTELNPYIHNLLYTHTNVYRYILREKHQITQFE